MSQEALEETGAWAAANARAKAYPLLALLSLLLVLFLVFLAYFLSNFWMVFLIPAIVLALVGYRAFVGNADRFFLVTDFLYYLGVGAILGLLGRYLPDLPEILRYDAQQTYEAAVAQLPDVAQSLGEVEALAGAARQNNDAYGPSVVSNCVMEWQFKLRSEEEDPTRLSLYPAGCEGPLGSLETMIRSEAETRTLRLQKESLEKTVAGGPAPDYVNQPVISDETLRWLLYQLFPALLLSGVALKIGKTMNAWMKQ